MVTDERNFRSSYYEKVGCHSVEEKKSLNKLLQDNVLNHAKLKQFCLSYTVPTTHRCLLWNIILGVMPLHKTSTDYIMEQRRAVYNDLLRAVNAMLYINSNTEKSKVMLHMWQLEHNCLLHPNNDRSEENFLEIVKVLLQVFENDVETYWLAKEFYALTRDIEKECSKLKEFTQALLKKEDIILMRHLEMLTVLGNDDLLNRLYSKCFAGIINESALVRVWDKICGGSRKILAFVFFELIKALRENVLKCNNTQALKALIEQIKDQDASIVNKAIKNWQINKQHSEITVY